MSPKTARKEGTLAGKIRQRMTSKAKPREVVVRMYNVGFGDAFLVLLPAQGRQRRMLVDCGSIANGPHDMGAVVKRLIDDVRDEDGTPRIDVVVATHRHRDHVSGFAQAVWGEVEVREVWMPWTEDPTDARARRIRTRHNRLATHMVSAFRPAAASGVEPEKDWSDPRFQMALNALTNEAAMATLHSGFSGEPKRRFLPAPGAEDRAFHTDVLPGVTVHVLGPSHDEEVISDMDPPAGHSYLALVDDADPGKVVVPEPFSESWWVEEDPRLLTQEERTAVEIAGAGLGEAALLALEKAVNGTSLFFVLQVGTAHLVFPGDAQWGTWKAAMDSSDGWSLLKKTTFYKIGHHGSHNATPVDFVNELGQGCVAMASVRPIKKWPEIPRKPLLDELRKHRATIVRSDALGTVPHGFTVTDDKMVVEARIPTY